MKICPNCHSEYVDTLNFCTKCGSPLVQKEGGESKEMSNQGYEEPGKKKPSVLKRILLGIVIVVIAVYFVVDYLGNATTYLRVSSTELLADKQGGKTDIQVDYDGFFWNIEDCPDWVELEKEDRAFHISVGNNLTGDVRKGIIVIASGKLEAKILIVQRPVATYIRTSQNVLRFPKSGGEAELKVQTDGCNWEIFGPEYCKAKTLDLSRVRISVPENGGYSKMGYLTIKEDGVEAKVKIIQGGVCQKCQGKGQMICPYCKGYPNSYWGTCVYCGGTGLATCDYCHGKGEIK